MQATAVLLAVFCRDIFTAREEGYWRAVVGLRPRPLPGQIQGGIVFEPLPVATLMLVC